MNHYPQCPSRQPSSRRSVRAGHRRLYSGVHDRHQVKRSGYSLSHFDNPINRLTAEIKFPVVARMRNCFGNYLW